MENDKFDQKTEELFNSVLDNKLVFKADYAGQKNTPLFKKWKSEIIEKYGKGCRFYYCKLDGLYFFTDKNKDKYRKKCPKCKNYCCFFCNNTTRIYDPGSIKCCVKAKIAKMFLSFLSKADYYFSSDKYPADDKPSIYNYIPFASMINFVTSWYSVFFFNSGRYKNDKLIGDYRDSFTSNFIYFLNIFFVFCFIFFICIPYFLCHYILIAILLIISIFNKKPLYGYCGIIDQGIVMG